MKRPDVEIGARVKARHLRFVEAPEDAEVEFHGDVQSESSDERKNLPDEVEPGVTYRDVEVRWRAGARYAPRRDDDS